MYLPTQNDILKETNAYQQNNKMSYSDFCAKADFDL
jgi:hypothetical protein